MKANRVLKILNVTRPTLVKYVKDGTIRTTTLPNGTYDYNDEDVYLKSGRTKERVSVIYSRVSTAKQKVDLENQEKTLMNWCNANGVKIAKSYKDVASGMNFDRKQFMAMLDDILEYKVDTVYITYKDRLSRISFDMFQKLFGEFGCKIGRKVQRDGNIRGDNLHASLFCDEDVLKQAEEETSTDKGGLEE